MTELERARAKVEKSLAKDGREYLAHEFEELVRADERAKAMAEQVRALKLAGVIEP